jgi:hypothetical protein
VVTSLAKLQINNSIDNYMYMVRLDVVHTKNVVLFFFLSNKCKCIFHSKFVFNIIYLETHKIGIISILNITNISFFQHCFFFTFFVITLTRMEYDI